MIEFIEGNAEYFRNGVVFEKAEVGDKFSYITYQQWSGGIQSALDLKVIRAGKRDIICTRIYGSQEEFTFKRASRDGNCYPIGHEKVIEARKDIIRQNRKHKCLKFLESVRKEFDDEFMDAVEAFEIRKAKSE
jgi:hypothetical protein